MARQKREREVSDERILEVCVNAKNMAQAVQESGLTFNAFKFRAVKLGCYKPSHKGAGGKKDLTDILEGKHPEYQSFKLRNRLIAEGIKTNQCEICGLDEIWNGKPIVCQLDHINGDRFNHRLSNLRLVCPNCHSQTETFSGKNEQHLGKE